MPLITLGRGTPAIPVDIADAVEMWARGRGRHARMEWHPVLGCPVIHFSARTDKSTEGESVMLNEWDAEKRRHVPLDLGQYGAGGIIALLEKADTEGRGEFKSLAEAVEGTIIRNRQQRDEILRRAEEVGRETAWLHRRSILGTPVVPGTNFTKES